jgi:CRISPR system Cascade subunit CasE
MTAWYLSRARLRADAPIAALRELLVPEEQGSRIAAAHRLVWTLFADDPDRRRDFLWREGEPGSFYILSARRPDDRHGLFDLEPPKTFAPALAAGDRLAFALRVNATVARKAVGKAGPEGRVRGGRCDIVMDALSAVPQGERAEARAALLSRVSGEWLARQGEAHGFEPDPAPSAEGWLGEGLTPPGVTRATGYRVLRVDRGPRASPMQAGVLDLEGTLTVRDPDRFVAAVRHGFGRAKAFGCGLMLIRRAA